jgi:putative ABC transport system permease protein
MDDFRIGLRLLSKTPGSTLSIAGLVALSIGASTAIFSLFDTLLLRPLPARLPERLVRIAQQPIRKVRPPGHNASGITGFVIE